MFVCLFVLVNFVYNTDRDVSRESVLLTIAPVLPIINQHFYMTDCFQTWVDGERQVNQACLYV